ncbi:MAG: hypothetical protein HQL90_04315 [Magnetococcales bacterium]|nr:hypothetical protein [Magnetococcales bacterium]
MSVYIDKHGDGLGDENARSAYARIAEDLRDFKRHASENDRELFGRMGSAEKTIIVLTEQQAMLIDALEPLKKITAMMERGRGAAWLLTAIIGVVMLIPVVLDLWDRMRK